MRKTRVGGKEMGVKFERRAGGGGVREVRTSGRSGVGTGGGGESIATSGSLKESGINRQLEFEEGGNVNFQRGGRKRKE